MTLRLSTLLLAFSMVSSATTLAAPEIVPFDSPRWVFEGEVQRVEPHLGRDALYLENASALLTDVDFDEGVIEFDVAFDASRGFSGVQFHRQGAGEYEQFYLRPHQSGNPDASQYQPVFGGHSAWQILHGPGYAATLEHRFAAWQHVKLVIVGGQAEVYVDSDEPVLFIKELQRHEPGGGLGLMSFYAPAHFANFRYERTSAAPLRGRSAPGAPLADGHILSWLVSSSFDEQRLALATDLVQIQQEPLSWTRLDVEANGVANLARTLNTTGNTVLARMLVTSERAQTVLLDFGFSDRVRAYVNGQLVYAGDNGYRTRDYRFLGTLGLFDTLALQLEAGPNDVTMAVSEDFGGFGVAARLQSMSGLSITSPTNPRDDGDR